MRVLLTGARAPVTLDLARHFHRDGHQVYLADSIHWPLARLSSVAKKTFVVSKPVEDVDNFVADLVRIVQRYEIDLLVPTCEEIYYLASRLESFPSTVRVFSEPLSKLEPLHNKWTFAQGVAGIKSEVQAPETHLLSRQTDVTEWLRDRVSEEWVFKPVYSRFAARALIGPHSRELENLSPHEADLWVAQKRIFGQEYSTYSIALDGRLTAHACYRSQYRAGPGSGIYFVSVMNPLILSFVDSFVSMRQFSGQVGFDFIEDGSGSIFVLECNPRATSGLHLLCGQPVSRAFLADTNTVVEPLADRPAMLGAIMMMYAFPKAMRSLELKRLVQDMWCARDVMFEWRDPWPTLLSPISLMEVVATSLKMHKPLTHAATFDIEWNGQSLG